MTVRELIIALLDQNMDAYVVIAKQPGADNGFSPLSAPIAAGDYQPENAWCGEFEEIEERLEYPGAVALYPTH